MRVTKKRGYIFLCLLQLTVTKLNADFTVKTRGFYWRFQAPLEAHLISNNATAQLPPKTTPTTPPYATAFPFLLRLSRHFHLPHCLTPIYVIDFSSLVKDHPVDRVHENWASHSTVLQPLQGLNHSGVQNQDHEPGPARKKNSVYLFMILFNYAVKDQTKYCRMIR
jgi:hypothetical protein